MVKAGTFREDLLYRLDVIAIRVPPLREHPEDIPLLAEHFFARCAARNGKPLEGIAPEAMAALRAFPWPGNIRELQHAMERAVVMSAGPLVGLADLPPIVRGAQPDARLEIPGATLADIERDAILRTLESTGGSTTKAAAILGVTTRTIQYRLQEYRRAEKLDRPALVEGRGPEDA
jgi:DNA-binding NtrC family response regulator